MSSTLVLALTAASVAGPTGQSPIVNTKLGPVLGTVEVSDQGVAVGVWRGVPFAATTSGQNRFRPPQPREPWTEPLNCTVNGYGCVQPHHGVDTPCGGRQIPGEKCEDEDCLNVNVFCPQKPSTDSAGYPVMLWMYGGAYLEGMNYGPLNIYDGTELAARGNVCVVATNYRLGVLGFLAVGGGADGNQAIQDQRAAMVWTQQNIRSFGGNPNSVTIFGESAGAMSVAVHLVSPASKGLFHRAIMESNVGAFRYSKASDQKASFGDKFIELANCTKGDLACLQNLDPFVAISLGDKASSAVGEDIIDRILEGGRVEDAFAMQWSPVVDPASDDLPGQPLALMAAGKWSPVPVLLGTNQDEGATFVYAGVSMKLPEALFPVVNDIIFGSDGSKVTKFYKDAAKGWHDTRDSLSYMLTDYWFKCSSYRIAELAAAAGKPAFVYRYEHIVSFASLFPRFGIPNVCMNRTCHMMEIPFVFHNHANYSFEPDELALTAAMLSYWTSFAKSSDPNTDNSPGAVTWPAYNGTDRVNIKLSIPITTESTVQGQVSGDGTVPPVSPPGVCNFYDSIGYDF